MLAGWHSQSKDLAGRLGASLPSLAGLPKFMLDNTEELELMAQSTNCGYIRFWLDDMGIDLPSGAYKLNYTGGSVEEAFMRVRYKEWATLQFHEKASIYSGPWPLVATFLSYGHGERRLVIDGGSRMPEQVYMITASRHLSSDTKPDAGHSTAYISLFRGK